jgi:electron transfer flavoprotein beta subunit
MNCVVCIAQVTNPETPAASFSIDPEARRAIPAKDRPRVINDYDQVAVEAALKIKETKGGKVTIFSLGPATVTGAIKHCLAMGADEGILLSDERFQEEDRALVAYALAMAIRKAGNFDLILCGRQEGDWDAGQVGLGIAEILDIPSVNPVKKIEVGKGTILVERIVDDGYELIELPLPALIGVSSELGLARYPTMKGIMTAARKSVETWTANDIGIAPSRLDPASAKVKMLRLFIPVRERACVFVEGETPEEAGVNLRIRLREEKIL